MPKLAGLEFDVRFGNWAKEPFTASSTTHVSVYRGGDHSPDP
jgi:hypothetical protein